MRLNFMYVFLLAISFTSLQCKKNSNGESNSSNAKGNTAKVVGYLYTTTNGEGENQVVQLARFSDGSVGNEKVYPTKGKGGSSHEAPAHGDYDAQGNLKIVGDFLLTTNPGDNTISVFKVNKKNGDLSFVSIVKSEGNRPVTIDFTPVSEDKNEYWVIVGNQWGTPTVLYENDKLKRYPSDAFLATNLKAADVSDKDRSLELFKLNMSNGELIFQKTLSEYVRENGGPADIKFSPDGKKIAVTLWGIPHFFAKEPSLKEMHSSRVYVYDFENGNISNPRFFEESGLSGAVGFNWNNNSETLYVSYFNIVNEKSDNGLVVLKDGNKKLKKVSNHTTGGGNVIDEACWTAISKDQSKLYVCSYVTNAVTTFSLDKNGNVSKTLNVTKRVDNAPLEDSKDLFISPNNKYLYMLGSFFSYSVNTLEITSDGTKYLKQYNLKETSKEIGNPGVYDLVGLDGFDL